jgi:2-polyprenyl-6-methoxyphenol hydroxylase-like FAD-dependent oxidoreductase
VLNVLISGCSIAGPALAHWLGRAGHRVTIVERAPRLRPGGQAIDVRGVALQVLARMNLLDEARSLRTRLKGVSAVDADGVETWRSEEETFSGGRFDAEDLEILRDDLSALLVGRASEAAEIIFGDSIIGMDEREGGTLVQFQHAAPRSFDVVVGADGLRSTVRDLVFGDDSQFVHLLGTGLAVFTVPNILNLHDWQIAHRQGRGGFLVYTARENTELRVAFGFPIERADEERGTLDEQKRLVAKRCAHFRWEIPRLLAAMWSAPDFHFGAVAQVRMERWSQGRSVLVGDAGYCPSPFSGQGTSLALVGAYVLAAELNKRPSQHEAAFRRYQQRMQLYVEANQALATVERDEAQAHALLTAAKNAIDLDID